MIQDAVPQIHARRQLAALVQIFVDRIATGEYDAGNQHLVADFQRADFFFGERKGKFDHCKVSFNTTTFAICAIRTQRHALAAIGPAHVADADEIGRRQAVRHTNFHAQQRRLAAKTHRADAEFVGRLQNVLLQLVQFRIRDCGRRISRRNWVLLNLVAGRAVAADAHAENARPAALALRLQHRVENRLAAAVQVAVGIELFVRQGVLRADVFAAAAFEHEPHAQFRRAMLMKMKRGCPGPQFVPSFLPVSESTEFCRR